VEQRNWERPSNASVWIKSLLPRSETRYPEQEGSVANWPNRSLSFHLSCIW
jgi:hypothetical protein